MMKLPARLRSSAICSSLGSNAKQRTVKASGNALQGTVHAGMKGKEFAIKHTMSGSRT